LQIVEITISGSELGLSIKLLPEKSDLYKKDTGINQNNIKIKIKIIAVIERQ
jgi:hypothetical protein